MTLALRTDAADVMRAVGIIRSVCNSDYGHVNAVLEALQEDPDEHALMRTFSALVAVGAVAAASLSLACVYPDEDEALDAIQRQIIAGDVPPPQPRSDPT
jgi:hypothetical protein